MKDIKRSVLFDKKWYLKQYSDVARAKVDAFNHYIKHGWHEGRNPSPRFDGNAYLRANPDVASAGMCPLVHYIRFGRHEGRIAVSTENKIVTNQSTKLKMRRLFMYPQYVYDEYHRLKAELKKIQ